MTRLRLPQFRRRLEDRAGLALMVAGFGLAVFHDATLGGLSPGERLAIRYMVIENPVAWIEAVLPFVVGAGLLLVFMPKLERMAEVTNPGDTGGPSDSRQ